MTKTKQKTTAKNPIYIKSLPIRAVECLLPNPKQIPLLFSGPLNSIEDINDIPFDSYEYQHDLIKSLLKKINKNLIKYNHYKIFFVHPKYKDYSCDIFGTVFQIFQSLSNTKK